jgi:hypothetical protein
MCDQEIPVGVIGTVQTSKRLTIDVQDASSPSRTLIDLPLTTLKRAWQDPLKWH